MTELNWFSGSNFYTGFTQDISEGGVFVVSYLTEPVGTEVTLDLGFTGGLEIHARGIVRWVREPRDISDESEPPGMGIQFLDLTDEQRVVIQSYVAHRDPLFYEAE